jgi:hypothetical protein
MALSFEWDPAKAAANLAKHGVRFEVAATAFGDPHSLTIPDPKHSQTENRLVLLGQTGDGSIVVVVHVERGDRIRLISARRASRKERINYGQET